MSETFKLTTGDPLFDPEKPVEVNGFLFMPAEGGRVVAGKPRPKVMVEGKRRRLVERQLA